jgi:5'-AMP-activated protein kinase catalytic alpha subunit
LKVADFGFSKILSETNNGITKTRVGTEIYMAPEIFKGKSYSAISCDLYSCGIVLFVLIAGHQPYVG